MKLALPLTTLILVLLLPQQAVLAQSSLPRLPTPTGLRLEDNTLHWQAVEGVSGYRVRHRIPGQPWEGANVPPMQQFHVLHDLLPDVVYQVQVRAQGATGVLRNSFWSAPLRVRLSATATPTVTPAPSATNTPTATATITVTPGGPLARVHNVRFVDHAGTVAWDAVGGAVRDYILAYRFGTDGASTAVKVPAGPEPGYQIPGFTPSLAWQVKVRARHATDRTLNGPQGNWVSWSPPP
ncbi:MAG: fibronectin type III domain-containing protein, partial [Anaerolineaceae bacterium]|nr:fibronectin type III domain-containing protein [Anaerolineaceae bacterium]